LVQNLIDFIHPVYLNKTLGSDQLYVMETWSAKDNMVILIIKPTRCIKFSNLFFE